MACFRFEILCFAGALLVLLASCTSASRGGLEVDYKSASNASLIVDTYEAPMWAFSETSGANQDKSVTRFKTDYTTVLGGERDLEVSYKEYWGGYQSSRVSIGDGVLAVDSCDPCTFTLTLQWDGEDESMDLQADGLGSVDLTDNGSASSLSFQYSDEMGGHAYLYVYSGSADDYCMHNTTLVEGSSTSTANVPYDSFTSVGAGCSFDQVGAIELRVHTEYGSRSSKLFYPLAIELNEYAIAGSL